MRKVGATHRTQVIGLLCERLAFERQAVKLYDGVIDKLAPRDGPFSSIKAHLRRIREEELAHAEWLEEQVRALGGDPSEETAALFRANADWSLVGADLPADAAPARLFHALVQAEVADDGGWELLLEIARRVQDHEAIAAFEQRVREEQEHLLFVRRIAAVEAGNELLDEAVTTLEDASA